MPPPLATQAELDGCRTILELGSGTGWLGMMVARNAPAVDTTLPQHDAPTPALPPSLSLGPGLSLSLTSPGPDPDPDQVALNAALSLRAVHAIPCDWAWFGTSGGAEEKEEGEEVAATAEEEEKVVAATADDDEAVAQARSVVQSAYFDLVIGSDLVYEEEGMRALVRVFAVLAARGVRILYAHTRYRFELLDMLFFEALE
eukprot:scaffold104549_cov48-Phaeocystis_antarctica.AAC.1